MKLVIDIDEDVRVAISRIGLLRVPDEMQKKVDMAIQHGTPLPKGHGKIIDESTITACEWNGFLKIMTTDAPTIIEADKEQEDGNVD